MRKIAALLLFVSLPAWASFIPGPVPDSGTYTPGTSNEMPMGAVFSDQIGVQTSTTTAALRMTPMRALDVNLRDNAGVAIGTGTANPLYMYQSNSSTAQVSNFPATYTVTPGTGNFNVTNSTVGAVPVGNYNVTNSTVGALITGGSIANTGFNVNNAPTVIQSTVGVNSSTIAVVNAVGTQLNVIGSTVGVNGTGVGNFNVTNSTVGALITGGSIANTGFNVNNAPTVIQSTVGVNSSTIAVVNAVGTQLNVTGSTVGVVGTGLFNVTNSTVGVVGTGVGLFNVTGSTVGVVGTVGTNVAAATTNRLPTLDGIAQNSYGNAGAVFTAGRDAAPMILSTSGLMGVAALPDITLRSYSASTVPFVLTNSTTDISEICGNATNVVLVYGLRVSCTQTTAGMMTLDVMTRSSKYTFAWSTITAVNQDQNYSNPVSSAVFFNSGVANNGTFQGYVDSYQLGCMASGTATPNDIYISPSNWRMKPIVLRGATQCLGVGTNGTSGSGAKYNVSWDWFEVSSP